MKVHPRELKKGDLVLMWKRRDEKLGKHGKFEFYGWSLLGLKILLV
jgi:hypothetical protein